MTAATARTVGVFLVAVLLAACNGEATVEPADNPTSRPVATDAAAPDPPTLDEDTAADLYAAWREIVYALPPTPPEAVDVESAGDGIVVPGSQAADWVAQELELAAERGVLVRGSVHAEALSSPQVTGDRATVTICSAADLGFTDVATGDAASDDAFDSSYTPFQTALRRIGDRWMVEGADPSDERDCVPPSIDRALSNRWEAFTEAWYERDRQGGGAELGRLAEVVTDRFAETLRGLPARDPVSDPSAYTDFETVTATRTTATSHACRSSGLETVEWMLVEGQWRIDFAGQTSQDATAVRAAAK